MAEEKEEPKHLPRLLKVVTTLAILYGNITFGCAMTAYSPALTDFKKKYDTDTATVSVVFSVLTGSYSAGALLCTVLYNVVNRQFAVVLLFIGVTATMLVSPHIPNVSLFYVVGGVLGFCLGCYDTAQIVWMMEMWQKDSGPFIQAQHFCYSLGSVIAPSLMSPFLTEEDEDTEEGVSTTTPGGEKEENSRLFVPFTIIGCLCACTAIAQLLLFIFMRYRPPPPEEKFTPEVDENTPSETSPLPLHQAQPKGGLVNWIKTQWPGWGVARLVILSCLIFGFDQGMEVSTMQLFPTFGQNSDVKLTESQSADTLTGLTMAMVVGRGASVLLIFKVKALFILIGNLTLVMAGNILLVIWGNSSKGIIWAAGILYGLGFSSLLPSFCAYMERYMEFTNTIGAICVVTGALVGAVFPLIIGNAIDDHPLVLAYPIFFSLAVIIGALALSYVILRKSNKRTMRPAAD